MSKIINRLFPFRLVVVLFVVAFALVIGCANNDESGQESSCCCSVATNEVSMSNFFGTVMQFQVKTRGTSFGWLKHPVGPLGSFRARVHPSEQSVSTPTFYYVDSEKKWENCQELLNDVDQLYDILMKSIHATVDMTLYFDTRDFSIYLGVMPGDGKISKEEGRVKKGVL